MPKEELDLLQLASRLVAEASAGSPEIVWRDYTKATI